MRRTEEQIRMLVQCERDMDAGKQPYVTDGQGNRWPFDGKLLAHLGIDCGQRLPRIVIDDLVERSNPRFQIETLDREEGSAEGSALRFRYLVFDFYRAVNRVLGTGSFDVAMKHALIRGVRVIDCLTGEQIQPDGDRIAIERLEAPADG